MQIFFPLNKFCTYRTKELFFLLQSKGLLHVKSLRTSILRYLELGTTLWLRRFSWGKKTLTSLYYLKFILFETRFECPLDRLSKGSPTCSPSWLPFFFFFLRFPSNRFLVVSPGEPLREEDLCVKVFPFSRTLRKTKPLNYPLSHKHHKLNTQVLGLIMKKLISNNMSKVFYVKNEGWTFGADELRQYKIQITVCVWGGGRVK